MVQTVPGNTWIDGGEENVAVAKTIHYTADEVKAGDYIYSCLLYTSDAADD